MVFFLMMITGLVVGSFLNVCIYRLPRGESVVFPPSNCPKCGRRIAADDLIPLISFLRLRGSCRFCGEKISPLYPLVELLTGLLFAVMYGYFGLSPVLLKYLTLGSVLIAVTFIDLEHYLIPDRLVIFALAAGLPLHFWAGDRTTLSALLGLLTAGGFLLFLAVVSRGGMGGGDIKLAAATGFYLGWPHGLLAVFLACVLAGLLGLMLVLARLKGRKDAIPFGPFIVAGTLAALFRGDELLFWLLNLYGIRL